MISPPEKIKHVLLAGFLTGFLFYADAQALKDHLQKGDRYFQKKDYGNALQNYLDALALDENDAHTNYKTGVSYLHEENYRQAVVFLEKAYNLKPDVDPQIDYHLGMAYREDHQFDKARKHFEIFKNSHKNLAAVAKQKIAECIIGDSLMRISTNATVRPVDEINTAFSEFSPLITRDGKALVFTSNRSEDDYQIKSANNFEDVYISQKQGEQWARPEKISPAINVKLNEAAISLSADGKTLFLYYEEGGGDIYTSTLENGAWSQPVPLNRFVNHPKYREAGACLSPDGSRLYFSSNRPGGKGGYDIYVSKMGANGQWGRPSNLGSTINTRANEESPFLHADGVTLYFSSNGHATLGNNDIFKSVFQAGKWTLPENLGYPINTSGYDGYFVLTEDGGSGYFTSRRQNAPGNTDIFMVVYSTIPSAVKKSQKSANAANAPGDQLSAHGKEVVTVLKGTVIDVLNTNPLEATISLVDNSDNRVISKITTDPSGSFELVIPHGGNFGITTEKPGYLFNSMNIKLPALEKDQEIDTHILLVKAVVGSKVVLKNVFFDVNQYALKPESLSELENIRNLLMRNPHWRIQINGHTDNIGHPKINMELSLKRAESVVQYLIKEGIAADRVQAKGYGSEKPLVSNDDEAEGRQINRRTEIEIIE